MSKLAPLFLLLGVALAASGNARGQNPAGPRYVDSQPAPEEFLHVGPSVVSVEFSEPLGEGSTMSVTDECGRRIDTGNIEIDDNEMRVALASKPSGRYTVSYLAQGTEKGSGAVPGSFGFKVHQGTDCDGGGGGHHHHDGGDGGDGGGNHGGHSPGDAGSHETDHPDSGEHVAAAHTSGEHTFDGAEHTRHDKKQRHRHRDRPRRDGSAGGPKDGRNGGDEIAGASTSAPDRVPEATGADVLLALGLAGAVGAVGGLILRSSPEH